eukprot:6319135-Heterocapsa_arctica.AAC.1
MRAMRDHLGGGGPAGEGREFGVRSWDAEAAGNACAVPLGVVCPGNWHHAPVGGQGSRSSKHFRGSCSLLAG